MEVHITNDVDKKTLAARLMSIVQKNMMGEEVSIIVSPNIPMNQLDEIFQKLAEFAALSWSMVKPEDKEEDNEGWKDSD